MEIFAAKGNALISRAAARDLYDWCNMIDEELFVNERDLFPVLSKKANFNLEEKKARAKEYISKLMVLTEEEEEYIKRFEVKEYMPKLLFNDEGILERIKTHPMALWKSKND